MPLSLVRIACRGRTGSSRLSSFFPKGSTRTPTRRSRSLTGTATSSPRLCCRLAGRLISLPNHSSCSVPRSPLERWTPSWFSRNSRVSQSSPRSMRQRAGCVRPLARISDPSACRIGLTSAGGGGGGMSGIPGCRAARTGIKAMKQPAQSRNASDLGAVRQHLLELQVVQLLDSEARSGTEV